MTIVMQQKQQLIYGSDAHAQENGSIGRKFNLFITDF